MMLTRFVRIQLSIFAVLTVIGLVVMSLMYVRLPQLVGIGQYNVTVELASTGGLYPHSNVTYRGNTVGTVKSVTLSPVGVDAVLSIDSGQKIPADVDAAVRSVSAVGEQYVDLVPHENGSADEHLGDGDVIPLDRTTVLRRSVHCSIRRMSCSPVSPTHGCRPSSTRHSMRSTGRVRNCSS